MRAEWFDRQLRSLRGLRLPVAEPESALAEPPGVAGFMPEPVLPGLIEPELPVVPDVAPAAPVVGAWAVPGFVAFGEAVEPEFTEPPLLFTPGPELAEEDVPPVEPALPPVLPD